MFRIVSPNCRKRANLHIRHSQIEAKLQGKISDCNAEIKTYEKEIAAHSVRIAELMQAHEHGVLSTTGDKLLIDFVTKTTKRPDSKLLKEKYPTVYADVLKTSESRKLKVSVTPI